MNREEVIKKFKEDTELMKKNNSDVDCLFEASRHGYIEALSDLGYITEQDKDRLNISVMPFRLNYKNQSCYFDLLSLGSELK